MKKNELIKKLMEIQDDFDIIVEGYEFGYNNVDDISIIPLEKNESSNRWEGEYIDADKKIDTTRHAILIKCSYSRDSDNKLSKND